MDDYVKNMPPGWTLTSRQLVTDSFGQRSDYLAYTAPDGFNYPVWMPGGDPIHTDLNTDLLANVWEHLRPSKSRAAFERSRPP